MGQEIKARGQVGLRYGKGDLPRIHKIYESFGSEGFTVRDVRASALPDVTSGEIVKWSSEGIVIGVGKTSGSDRTPVKIWKLSGTVIAVFDQEDN